MYLKGLILRFFLILCFFTIFNASAYAEDFLFLTAGLESNIEAWISNGTSGGTKELKDISSGSEASFPTSYFSFKDKVYFVASPGDQPALWVTSGTEGSTRQVKVLDDRNDVEDYFFTICDGKLFFVCKDSENGTELWITDGTDAGTKIVKDINPGSDSSRPESLTVMGNKLYFKADDGTHGNELWVSDGTVAGTHIVKDINSSGGSSIGYLVMHNEKLYFKADGGSYNSELWVSDGTGNGTELLKDLNDGGSSDPKHFTCFNGKIYFEALDKEKGSELFVSDGTAEGTQLFWDISPTQGSSPTNFIVVGDKLFFTANDDEKGGQLFVIDGSSGEKRRVTSDFKGSPRDLTKVGNKVYFSAEDEAHGRELWLSDGTEDGTCFVKDLVTGPEDVYPRYLVEYKDKLYFTTKKSGSKARKLWVSDGTDEGTKVIHEDLLVYDELRKCSVVLPSPPVVTSKPVKSATSGEKYLYTLAASDKDNDELTWKVNEEKALPEWLSLETPVNDDDVRASNEVKVYNLTGTPGKEDIGDHEVSLILSDGSYDVEHKFTITVKAKSKPVDPTPPSPSEPEEENDIDIDSGDGYYESVFKKYKRSITGTGKLTGTIKATGSSSGFTFSAETLKGLNLNNDGSYTFDSSGYKDLKKGERKTVKTSAKITDEKGHTFNFTIEIEVTGENDAPEIGKINNIIKYSNFDEVVIPVQVNDPDNNTNELVFSLEVKDPSIAEISLENNNQLRIVSEPGISGTTGISLKVSDGEKTSIMTFKLKVLSMEDGDNVDEAGDVEVEVEGDVTKTKVKVPEDGIEIETKEDESTGNVEYDLNQNNKNSHAKSEIKGSKVEISNKGAEIIYEEEDLELKVSSTITGETRDQITKNGKTTEFISKIPGGDTKIGEKDSRVEIETDLKVWETKEIKAVVGEDGSFKEEVTVNGKTTKISTKVPGSKTILDENESLKTNLELTQGSDGSSRKINAVAITDPKGESQTWFEENGSVLERTISEKTPLETGTEIEIIQNGLEIEFRIKTDLTRELIIE